MVLAYEDDEGNGRKTKKRETFEKNLKEQGLHLETELKTVSNIGFTDKRQLATGKMVRACFCVHTRPSYMFDILQSLSSQYKPIMFNNPI